MEIRRSFDREDALEVVDKESILEKINCKFSEQPKPIEY